MFSTLKNKQSIICFLVIVFTMVLTISNIYAKEEPPRGELVAEEEMENVQDNSWSDLILEEAVSSGSYYIEMTDIVNKWGAWGSKLDPYPDGTVWQDDAILEECDLKLHYRPTKGADVFEDLIAIQAQGAIGDNWFPFEAWGGHTSLGQSFVAPGNFDAVGLSTPTWNTNNSGGKLTLYSQEGLEKAVINSKCKITITWGHIKAYDQ